MPLRSFAFKSFELRFTEELKTEYVSKEADISWVLADRNFLLKNFHQFREDASMTAEGYDYCVGELARRIRELSSWNFYASALTVVLKKQLSCKL